jgi:hypothetical protein
MKWITAIVVNIAWTVLYAGDGATTTRTSITVNHRDSTDKHFSLASYVKADKVLSREQFMLQDLPAIILENKMARFTLGRSQQGRLIPAWYFPGRTSRRALVIAGVHGSELSAIEVAYALIEKLVNGEQPYYSVIVVPSLFPDNARKAIAEPEQIGSVFNIGRYTQANSVDPNRQMPSPGKPFNEISALDHLGRKMETENQLLLELIRDFNPARIVNIHAIRNPGYGGIYADPRTDANGIALGFTSDSSLAVAMARFVDAQGGNVAGNKLDEGATALYYKDPAPAPAGFIQKRNMAGSALNAHRGCGISLGTWASTAVRDSSDPAHNREAIRIITMEYPGCKRPGDYPVDRDAAFHQNQVGIFAGSIHQIFLQDYFTEIEDSHWTKN